MIETKVLLQGILSVSGFFVIGGVFIGIFSFVYPMFHDFGDNYDGVVKAIKFVDYITSIAAILTAIGIFLSEWYWLSDIGYLLLLFSLRRVFFRKKQYPTRKEL